MTYCEVDNGLFAFVAAHEPSWRLTDVPETEEERAGWNELNGKWNDPLFVIRWQSLANAIINPVDKINISGS